MIVTSKPLLIAGVALILFGLSFLAIILNNQVEHGKYEAAFATAFFGSILVIWMTFYLNKFIHLRVEKSEGVAWFGTVLFTQDVRVSSIQYVGRFLFFRRIHKVIIKSKWYLVNCDKRVIDQALSLDES